MAISAGAIWRVRIGGSNTLCSGLFDPTIVGAGADYTEQDTAQLALTDLASATPYTTITSATGGFTAAMVGNGIYIASGTGFTAGRYIITAYTSSNSVTVDRACATVNASAGVAKVGGALAHFSVVSAAAPYTAVAGNVIMVRGQGLNDPVDIDYSLQSYAISTGLSIIGYNGRPKISHNGYGINTSAYSRFENLSFVAVSLSQSTYGVLFGGLSLAFNCVFDSGGFDMTQVTSVSVDRCSFINTGLQSLGTRPALVLSATAYSASITNSLFKDQRFKGAVCGIFGGSIHGNIFQNNNGDGLEITTPSLGYNGPMIVENNTFYNNAGHGILSAIGNLNIRSNVFASHTGSGKYGIYITDGLNAASHSVSGSSLAGNCFYGNTNNSNIPLPASTLTVDPQFANAPVDLTPTNTALRTIGGVGAL